MGDAKRTHYYILGPSSIVSQNRAKYQQKVSKNINKCYRKSCLGLRNKKMLVKNLLQENQMDILCMKEIEIINNIIFQFFYTPKCQGLAFLLSNFDITRPTIT